MTEFDPYEDFKFYYQSEVPQNFWESAPVAVDTNVLLNLHEYREDVRQSLFEALVSLGDRLFIPYHVATEYHVGRDNIIRRQSAKLEQVSDILKDTKNKFKGKIDKLALKDSPVSFDPTELIRDVQQLFEEKGRDVQSVLNQCSADPMSDEMVAKFQEKLLPRVGPPLSDQELEEIFRDAPAQLEAKMGAGFEDYEDKSQERVSWQDYDGPTYDKRFSDYVIFRQVLREFEGRPFVLVSNENKPDWVRIEAGRVVGPQRFLLYEARRRAKIPFFLVVSAADFMAQFPDISADQVETARDYDKKNHVSMTESLEGLANLCDPTASLAELLGELAQPFHEVEIWAWISRLSNQVRADDRKAAAYSLLQLCAIDLRIHRLEDFQVVAKWVLAADEGFAPEKDEALRSLGSLRAAHERLGGENDELIEMPRKYADIAGHPGKFYGRSVNSETEKAIRRAISDPVRKVYNDVFRYEMLMKELSGSSKLKDLYHEAVSRKTELERLLSVKSLPTQEKELLRDLLDRHERLRLLGSVD